LSSTSLEFLGWRRELCREVVVEGGWGDPAIFRAAGD